MGWMSVCERERERERERADEREQSREGRAWRWDNRQMSLLFHALSKALNLDRRPTPFPCERSFWCLVQLINVQCVE